MEEPKYIIIVEDDKGIQEAARLVFERDGYGVTIFSNGDLLLTNAFDIPHLFILDKQLPGVDGLDICRFLKGQNSTKDVPIIMLSASPNIDRLAEMAGANCFLEKPFKMKTLRETVAKCIAAE